MAVKEQVIEEEYAIYNGDCIEVLETLPDESVDLSVYSPPFCGLYNYSSDPRDMSNNGYTEFFEHYMFLLEHISRVTKAGRVTTVHCMDIPAQGARIGGLIDFPGDIIQAHKKVGFKYWTRRNIWKEPLRIRNRTMSKGLAHKTIVEDSLDSNIAGADYLLQFRKKGKSIVPVTHTDGFLSYAGCTPMPPDAVKYRGYMGDQIKNKFSHWIWQQYASSDWNDVRPKEVLPYKASKEPEDEQHVHPLQLDIIERAVALWSNPGEVVLSPFMGIGSEIFVAVKNKRKGIGIELKTSYFQQACRNLKKAVLEAAKQEQGMLF